MTTNSSINAPVITLGGPVTFSGAFDSTFTLTGDTSVTFPTSGTLATTASAGSLTFLASRTASSSSTIDFANLLNSTYDNYLVTIENLLPSTNVNTLQLRVGTGGTPTYQATNYSGSGISYSGVLYFASNGTAIDLNYQSRLASTASRVGCNYLYIFNANGSTDKTVISNLGIWDSVGVYDTVNVMSGRWQGATVLTSLRFLMASGNISTGIFKLYGITN